jgi:5-methylcytosine-specific restriction endonuclease McrA
MTRDDGLVEERVTWEVVHEQLTLIAKRRATLDAEEARWLREAEALQIWKPLGMVNALDYMERTLGYAPHTAHERLRVARSLAGLPVMENAFSEGRLGFTAVRELTRVATPATEAAWVDAAVGKTLREIEPMVANHQPGDHPDDPPTPQLRTKKLCLDLPPETYAAWRQAHLVLDEEHGRRLEDHELLDILARRGIADVPVRESTGRATYQVAVMACPCCKRVSQEGGGELIPVGPEVIERAMCDVQWIGSIADSAQEQVKASQDVPPTVVRFIYRRDHGRCRVPGCRSTRCLEIHHIIHRADGGTHDVSNLILACSSCHKAHHDGRLIISGTSDELRVVRPAESTSHVGRSAPLADAIARVRGKATINTVDPSSHVGQTSTAVTEARSALVNMGWSASIARPAVDRAAAALPADATVEAIVRAALKHCPSGLHMQVRARDGDGPTWERGDERGAADVDLRGVLADRAALVRGGAGASLGDDRDRALGEARDQRAISGGTRATVEVARLVGRTLGVALERAPSKECPSPCARAAVTRMSQPSSITARHTIGPSTKPASAMPAEIAIATP